MRPRCSPRPAGPRLLALALAAALSGCGSCAEGGFSDANGLLSTDGVEIDFGSVVVGQEEERRFVLRNTGRGLLRIRAVERADDLPASFRFELRSAELDPGAEGELTVFFKPADEGAAAGALVVRSDSAVPELRLTVRGLGLRPRLVVEPAALAFGPVVVGENVEQRATITNAGALPVDLQVGAPVGRDGFVFSAGFPGGEPSSVRLAPGAAVELSVTFQPASVGEAEGEVAVRACAACEGSVIALRGRGVAAALVPEPAELDFGPVLPGARAVRPLVLHNIGSRAVSLLGVRPAEAGTDFDVEPLAASPLVLPGETVTISVGYRPSELGFDASRLVVATDDPRTPSYTVDVRGYGGGPDLQLSPASLDFGTVGLQYPVTRRLVLRNQGPADPATDLDVLLVRSAHIEAGEFRWSAADGQALPLAVDAGARAALEIRYAPVDLGPDAAELVLETNDPLRPVVRVPLTGTGAAVYSCDYTLQPAASPGLQFGVVGRGRTSRLTFQLRNAGPTDCLIGKVDLAPETPAAFALPEGPVYGRLLAPGEVQRVDVEFTPPGTAPSGTDFAGLVAVEIASDRAPRQLVQLSGRGAEVCLQITPPGADFGVIRPTCQTNERAFTLYNACRSTVRITSLEQRLGDDAFALVRPALPATLATGEELRFAARYAPPVVGQNFGTIEVFTDQLANGGQPYVLTLEGRADPVGRMTEEFVQAERAKADILFVVDDSPSMEEEQATLSREFGNFMRFAVAQGIDYHLAVTTTGNCGASSPRGRFLPLGSPGRIVTPLTLRPEATFAANVNVGTDGCSDEMGLEAAYLALSDPNLNGPNAGFLRSDAVLSVVVVSDEEDSSPRPLDFYVNFLRGLKGARGANLVTFGGIVGTRSGGCTGAGGQADYAPRYVTAAARLNGLTESICASTWSTALQRLGLNAFGYRSRFLLGSDADPETVEVFVDDRPVPAGALWAYSAGVNAIDFDSTAIPPPGARIRVTYRAACP
jgi:hypothetical protein